MGVSICDLCGEAVSKADLVHGVAYHRGERLICGACDRAMGGGGAHPSNAGGPTDAFLAARKKKEGFPYGLTALGLLTLGLAGFALWQVQELGRAQEYEGQTARTFQANSERQWGLFRTGQSEQLDEGLEAARADLLIGRDAMEQDLRKQQADLREALNVAVEELQSTQAQIQSELRSLAEGIAGDKSDGSELLSDMAKMQSEWNQRFQSQAAEMRLISERLDEAESAWLPSEQPPGGDASAPWFAITKELSHENAGIRLEALYSLEQSHDVRICSYLLPLLKDRDPLVRVACARILAEHDYRPATPQLIDGLEDSMLSVRTAFLDSLRAITGRQFGFRPDSRESERIRPLQEWRAWWAGKGADFLAGQPG